MLPERERVAAMDPSPDGRKMRAIVPSLLALWTTVLDVPALRTTVLPCQKEKLSEC